MKSLAVALCLFLSCALHAAEPFPADKTKLLGAWKDESDETYTFHADGVVTYVDADNDKSTGRWALQGSKLIFTFLDPDDGTVITMPFDILALDASVLVVRSTAEDDEPEVETLHRVK